MHYFRPQTGKVANVILASDVKNDVGDGGGDGDDAEAYLVEEAPKDNLSLELEAAATSGPAAAAAAASAVTASGQEGQHGALVQEILDTQKQLETEHKRAGGHVEIVRMHRT